MSYLDSAGLAHFWGKVKSALAGKQNVITAGDGLTKEGDTLSVTTPVRSAVTQAEFDALPEARRSKGFYVIPDGREPAMEVYSEGEAVIGTYLGKPLYRKKFTGVTPSTTAGTSVFTLPPNIEAIVKRYGGFVDTYNSKVCIPCSFPDASIDIYASGTTLYMTGSSRPAEQNRPFFLWLEYTKTTD